MRLDKGVTQDPIHGRGMSQYPHQKTSSSELSRHEEVPEGIPSEMKELAIRGQLDTSVALGMELVWYTSTQELTNLKVSIRGDMNHALHVIIGRLHVRRMPQRGNAKSISAEERGISRQDATTRFVQVIRADIMHEVQTIQSSISILWPEV